MQIYTYKGCASNEAAYSTKTFHQVRKLKILTLRKERGLIVC